MHDLLQSQKIALATQENDQFYKTENKTVIKCTIDCAEEQNLSRNRLCWINFVQMTKEALLLF